MSPPQTLEHVFLIGTEEGRILKCSTAFSAQYSQVAAALFLIFLLMELKSIDYYLQIPVRRVYFNGKF